MASSKSAKKVSPATPVPAPKKKRLSRADVPSAPLDEALRIPRAIHDSYADQPSSALNVALALNMTPSGGAFKALTGSAIGYGLTEGGAQAETISLTEIGLRAVAPTVEGDDIVAKRQAFLRPRVIGEFLGRYDAHPVPAIPIAKNVLEAMGVPRDATERTLNLILDGAMKLGLIRELKDKKYVQLQPNDGPSLALVPPIQGEDDEVLASVGSTPPSPPPVTPASSASLSATPRVFVTHGNNKKIVDQLRDLLTFGDLEPVISVEKEATAKPVPDKVMDDMRSCGAAIVHVGAELRLMDADGEEHIILNPNVLIEIGAAMALYKRNFILLVEKGVTLPSNLQGLYEVRYEGKELDYEATLKVMKALKQFKAEG